MTDASVSPPPIGTLHVSTPPPDPLPAPVPVQGAELRAFLETVESFTARGEMIGSETGHAAADAKPEAKPEAKQEAPAMRLGQQQDLTECLDNVGEMLETALKTRKRKRDGEEEAGEPEGGEGNAIRSLFYGLTRQHLSSPPAAPATKDEDFSYLIVKPSPTLMESLEGEFGPQEVDWAEGTNGRGMREVGVARWPPVLTVVINRVQYDREKQRAFKNQEHVRFGATMRLGRFSDSGLAAAHALREREGAVRAELAALEEKLKAANKGHMGEEPATDDVQTLLNESLDYLTTDLVGFATDGAAPVTLGSDLVQVIHMVTEEQVRASSAAEACETEIGMSRAELAGLWTGADSEGGAESDYTLHAVFMHRGQASYGHYWIYIRDHPTDQWYKFNDSSVTAISPSTVFGSSEDDPTANAYCLVYVRTGEISRLVNVRAREEATKQEYRAMLGIEAPDLGMAEAPAAGEGLPAGDVAAMAAEWSNVLD